MSRSGPSAFDGWVEAPPPGRGRGSKSAEEWKERFAEARKNPGRWGVLELDTAKQAASGASTARKHAKAAPGGAEAYVVTARSMPDGTGRLYVRYVPSEKRAKAS